MTNSVVENQKCHRVMKEKTYWKGVVPPSVLYGEEVIVMKKRRQRQITKSSEDNNWKNSEGTEVKCNRGINNRRNRNKQHEDKNSKEQDTMN